MIPNHRGQNYQPQFFQNSCGTIRLFHTEIKYQFQGLGILADFIDFFPQKGGG